MPYRKTPEVFWCYKCRFVSFHCLQKPIERFCFRKLRVTIANKRDFFFAHFRIICVTLAINKRVTFAQLCETFVNIPITFSK